jgi:hypothetical protein
LCEIRDRRKRVHEETVCVLVSHPAMRLHKIAQSLDDKPLTTDRTHVLSRTESEQNNKQRWRVTSGPKN